MIKLVHIKVSFIHLLKVPLLPCNPPLTSVDVMQQDVRARISGDTLATESGLTPHPEGGPQSLTADAAAPASAAQGSKLAASEVPKVVSEAVSRAAAVPHDGNQDAAPPAPANMVPNMLERVGAAASLLSST